MIAKSTLIRSVWSICFAAGAFNHAKDIVAGGWLPYTFMPLPFNMFWTALLPLDAAAAVLVWVRPKWGAALGLAIMIVDVAVNFWTVYGVGHNFGLALPLQIAFLVFVTTTASIVANAHAIGWSQE